ncbi:hypothetical protein ACFLZR_00330 [Candidatus Neomarinimicrobiota bacterium]
MSSDTYPDSVAGIWLHFNEGGELTGGSVGSEEIYNGTWLMDSTNQILAIQIGMGIWGTSHWYVFFDEDQLLLEGVPDTDMEEISLSFMR